MLTNDDDVKKLLKARFIYESDGKHPKGVLHRYAENIPLKRVEAILNDLPDVLYAIQINCKIPNDCTHYTKNKSFPLTISSVNVAKSVVSCGFDHIYWRHLQWKTSNFVQWHSH